ncbi:MAG: FkbM family methyltransferase [Deltaproteobacteria bacterium]|nr:FkbM family methyltransferase [Deltaproteobacteria bacterium]
MSTTQLFNILKFIYTHPFNSENRINGILRFFKWQISCLLNQYPIIYQFTENSRLIIAKGMTSATGNLYCGLAEYNEMGFLLHFLRQGDLFIDIGANIGAYTILASAEIGANTIAIEPIPPTFKILLDNILVNRIHDRVKALNIGLGSKNGKLRFTTLYDSTNHVATGGETNTIEVEVSTLDTILSSELIPVLLKIDVEGFETEVLNGAEKTLGRDALKAIIIELNGLGKRYGYDDLEVHKKLLNFEFKPFMYNPQRRRLEELETFGAHNTIYLRDKKFVEDRIRSARRIKIGNTPHII